MDSVALVCEKGMTNFYPVRWSDTGSLDLNMGAICHYFEMAVHSTARRAPLPRTAAGLTLLQGALIVPKLAGVQTFLRFRSSSLQICR
jgi:hypothetical protein